LTSARSKQRRSRSRQGDSDSSFWTSRPTKIFKKFVRRPNGFAFGPRSSTFSFLPSKPSKTPSSTHQSATSSALTIRFGGSFFSAPLSNLETNADTVPLLFLRRRLLQLLVDLKSGGSGEGVQDSGLPSSTPAPVRTIDRFSDEEKALFRSAKILIAEGELSIAFLSPDPPSAPFADLATLPPLQTTPSRRNSSPKPSSVSVSKSTRPRTERKP